jgi:ubiquinone/menaquinone biosynthesis C-methylase UbiE
VNPKWLFNEMRPSGTDYNELENVRAYDEQMKKIRDVAGESRTIIEKLKLSGEETVLEFGSGTGEFAVHASKHCRRFFAVDVSPAMLAFARLKADHLGLTNISFTNAGFLSYSHSGEAVDAVVSQLTLHHLPDFWKQIALHRLFTMLKPGGKLFLKDTVYSFAPRQYREFFEGWIRQTGTVDTKICQQVESHIREEFSTSGWIMEGILREAGFTILEANYEQGFLATYLCEKETTTCETG